MSNTYDNNERPEFDTVLQQIADYVLNTTSFSDEAYHTARWCLMDSLGCALLALNYPECQKRLGPIVPGAVLETGAHVPGTSYILDPVHAAFNFGAMVRWLDFNDTWLAAEWGHPSDNLGGILMLCDYLSRLRRSQQQTPLTIKTVLTALIKAHEIQGVLALENSFNRAGLDHVVLVKVASVAVLTHLLGGNREQILNALSLAWVDGQSLRTYRHAPNTGARKSWAAGDATSRALRLAFMAMQGEMGYPSVLTAKTWGFCDASFRGQTIKVPRQYTSYVMENVLFKISYPAEFHAQTAVEAAIRLHPLVIQRLSDIERIEILTQESAVRIISKVGPLHNPADRDHCLQYMVAIGLLFGELNADHYEDTVARDPRIDSLREKMLVREELTFSQDYLDPEKRSIANSLQVFFKEGTQTEVVRIDYPLGHRRRRAEGIPVLKEKLQHNLSTRLPAARVTELLVLSDEFDRLAQLSVDEFVDLFGN